MVPQLQEADKQLLHKYLHALFTKDSAIGYDYHPLQLELYAQYDQNAMLPFLKQAAGYKLEAGMIAVCNKANIESVGCVHASTHV